MRQARKLRAGARYHVTARVNNKEFLMTADRAKELFEEVLVKARERYSFSIENFVIMDNHFHLIVRPLKEENLSRIMQWIMSVYAMTINRRLRRSGHFWGSRFFSKILSSLADFLATFLYIDNNPVAAGLVDRDGRWQYSGSWHRRCGKVCVVSRLEDELALAISLPSPLLLAGTD